MTKPRRSAASRVRRACGGAGEREPLARIILFCVTLCNLAVMNHPQLLKRCQSRHFFSTCALGGGGGGKGKKKEEKGKRKKEDHEVMGRAPTAF